jgi:hypothetical protein
MKMALLLLAATVLTLATNAGAESKTSKHKSTAQSSPSDGGSPIRWDDLEQPGHSVVGYLGTYLVGIYPLPLTIGADYRMLVPNNPEWAMRAGFLYWTASGWSTGGGTVSLLDLNVGFGHVWTIRRVEIEGGGLLAFDTFKIDHEFLGWDVFTKTGTSLVIAPYAAGSFKFTKEWSVGVEFRVPYYFHGGGLLLQPYVLSQGQYHF